MEIFLLGLFIVATMTSLFTEGIKKWLHERNKTVHANALAGYVAIVLSVVIGIAYVIVTEATINAKMVVFLIALMLLSWLSAMVGYDKVRQAISQFKVNKEV